MKIFIPNESKQTVGGGFTFVRNFTKYAKKSGAEVITGQCCPVDADIFFIAGATMVTREKVEEAKRFGKKIVLRVDNAPRNSRNRNTGTSRLKSFADIADLIVYQSQWAREYLMPFLGKDGVVILNGADEEIFNMAGPKQPREAEQQYLYVQYNRDESKRWHEAWYRFSMLARKNSDSHLWIVGNFSPENLAYGFDFFMGERFRYAGVLDRPEDLAEYYRGADMLFLPYYNDACSNVMVEARLSGVPSIIHNGTGGNEEIMQAPLEYLLASRMALRYVAEFAKLL